MNDNVELSAEKRRRLDYGQGEKAAEDFAGFISLD
jgi:hypothetical protein